MKRGDARTGPRARDPFERWVDRVMAERREVERLVEALDAIGYDLEGHPECREALAKVFQLGHMLSNALALIEPETYGQRDWPEFAEAVDRMVAVAPSVRADFLRALPADVAQDVREAVPGVAANPEALWLEVEEMRGRIGDHDDPAEDETLAFIGEELAQPLDLAPDARVLRREARPLPSDGRLEPWLTTLRANWLRITARLYGIDPAGRKRDLVARTAAAQRHRPILQAVLGRCLGDTERHELAMLAWAGAVDFPGPWSTAAASRIDWCWDHVPASPGGQLRAVALMYVGRGRAGKVAAVPAELQDLLVEVMEDAFPEALSFARARWVALPGRLAADPSRPDPRREEWEAAVEEAQGYLERLAAASAGPVRETRPELTTDHLALDRPDARRTIARLGAGGRVRAVLDALADSRVSLYGVVATDWPRGATLQDRFRGGEPRFVHDRRLAGLAPGVVCGGRVYAAGPFTFWRPATPWFLGTDAHDAALEREFARYGRERGTLDRSSFLRDRADFVLSLAQL